MKSKQKDLLSLSKQFGLLIVVSIVLILFTKFGWLNPVVNLAQNLTIPVQIGFNQTYKGFSNTVLTVTQIGNLRSQNSKLQIENAQLKAENYSLQKLEAANKTLRSQLNTPTESIKIKVAAQAIGNSGLGTKNVLLLDKGKNNGVKEGDLVIVKNILLGKIINVSPKVSSMQLLSDPDTKIPVVTPGGAEGILEGEFGSNISLTNILQGAVLKNDDIITTSGKDNYPPGLVVGKVVGVSKIDKEFYQKATLQPLIEIKDLDLVFLIPGN